MPEREVPQSKNLPHTVLFDILVLVYASFPPLHQTARVRIFDAFMCTCGHHAAEAAFSAVAVGADVHDTLDLRVVEKEAVDGAIAAFHEGFGEATDV